MDNKKLIESLIKASNLIIERSRGSGEHMIVSEKIATLLNKYKLKEDRKKKLEKLDEIQIQTEEKKKL